MGMSESRYWKDDKQTRSAMRRHPGDDTNLWMHTGDKGIMDNDGYLRSECCKHAYSLTFPVLIQYCVVVGRMKVITAS